MSVRIEYNNTSVSSEPCGICGENAGRKVGGSRIPIELFSDRSMTTVCPTCAHKHAPELAKMVDDYYETALEERKDK